MEKEGSGSNAREAESPARIIEEVGLTRTGFPACSPLNHQWPRRSFRQKAYSVICGGCKYPHSGPDAINVSGGSSSVQSPKG